MKQNGFIIQELRKNETDRMLELRNTIFGELSREHWNAMGNTAVVAKKGSEFMGAIPLQFRQYMINGTTALPVVFENAVGVSEKARGTGIGTIMIEEAARFIADRSDALFVYRGGERSPAYRYYRKTHHGDIYNYTKFILKDPKGSNNGVSVHDYQETYSLESQLLKLFHANYRTFGGYWKREKGYYKKTFNAHVYRNEKWKLFLSEQKNFLNGYAIINPEEPFDSDMHIYDIAAKDRTACSRLLSRIAAFAREKKKPLRISANREFPYYDQIVKAGFTAQESTPYIMARMLNPEKIFKKLLKGSPLLRNLALTAVTPHRTIVLNKPSKAPYQATLYLKEALLSRLLSCRLDFAKALDMDLIRLTPVPRSIERQLSKALPYVPWVTFRIDYV